MFPNRPGGLASLIQVGQIPPEELGLRLEEFRHLVGPSPAREDLVRHLNQNRGRVHWSFNSFARQHVTDVIKAQAASNASNASTSLTDANPRPGASLAGTARSLPTVPIPLPSALTSLQSSPASASASAPAIFTAVVAPAASYSPIVKEVFAEDDEVAASSSSSSSSSMAGRAVSPPEKRFVGAVLEGREETGVLPVEILYLCFTFLKFGDLVKTALVCKQWRRIANDELLWKKLTTTRWKSPPLDQFSAMVRSSPQYPPFLC